MSENNPFEKVVIKIDNMHCDHCVDFVQKALDSFDGVTVKKIKKGKVDAIVHKDIPNVVLYDLIQSNDAYTVTKIKR